MRYNRMQMPARIGTSDTSADGISFDYDAFGTRTHKNGPNAEVFYLDDAYVRTRATATGDVSERLVFNMNDRPVAELEREADGDETIAYLHTDRLGSVEVMTDDNGVAIESREYEAFGQRRDPATATQFGSTRDFAGHELDREFGFINMKARLYDPSIGRFTSPDPILAEITSPEGPNPYRYVANNPVNLIDPLGLQADCDGLSTNCPQPPAPTDCGLPICIDGETAKKIGKAFKDAAEWFAGLFDSGPPGPPQLGPAVQFDARGPGAQRACADRSRPWRRRRGRAVHRPVHTR